MDDYGYGKPEPHGFLMALEYLGILPNEALVFEDARSGILASRRAGIRVAFIREFADHECSHIADMSFDDFDSFYDWFVAAHNTS